MWPKRLAWLVVIAILLAGAKDLHADQFNFTNNPVGLHPHQLGLVFVDAAGTDYDLFAQTFLTNRGPALSRTTRKEIL